MGDMVIVTFKIPRYLLEELDRYALANGVSRSEAIREAIRYYLQYQRWPLTPRIRIKRVVLT